MPYPSYITKPTRLMVPNMFGDPYKSTSALRQAIGESPFAPSPAPQQPQQPQQPAIPGQQPRIPERESFAGGAYTAPTAPTPKTKVEVTPFMTTLYGSLKNIDPEQRVGYLQNAAKSIKVRLDRYEFRLARGIPLSPDQQRRYDSLQSSFNDIQKYVNDPKPLDDYFTQVNANIASAPLTTNQQVSAGIPSPTYDYFKNR